MNQLDDTKEKIRAAVDIRQYAESRGVKKRNGRFVPPWRPDSDSGGLSVSADAWHDHARNEGGDIFTFVQRLDKVSFRDALRSVARYAEITLPESEPRDTPPAKKRIVETYDYTDEDGATLFQVLRYEPKSFRQRRPDGNGGYVWNLKGARRVLYNLPGIAKAERVFICEGEKDCDALSAAGVTATTSPAGAGKFLPEYAGCLEGKEIIVIPDNDAPGKQHAEDVAAKVHERARLVKVLQIPGLPAKGDVSDWLSNGGNVAELMRLADDAAAWEPQKDGRAKTSPENGKLGGREKTAWTELANRFVETIRDDAGNLLVRFHRGQWYRYRAGCYESVSRDEIRGDVMQWLREDSPRNATNNGREIVIGHLAAADVCLMPSRVQAPVWIDAAGTFPSAAGWIAMSSGLLHVRNLARRMNGESVPDDSVFREHTPQFFSTWKLDYNFEHAAACEKWGDYICTAQGTEGARVLQMLFGLSLVPDCSYNVAFFLFGEGGTGKSVALYVLRHLVGDRNVCCLPLAQFADKFSTYKLTESLVNIVGDGAEEDGTSGNMRQIEGVFKDVTDGGMIAIERKHQEPGQAPAIARCIFATNSLPHFSDRSSAMWDRLRIIPFERRFRGTVEEQPRLKFEIVENELPGVFAWAVMGLADLLKEPSGRFPEHPAGFAVKDAHRAACDPERCFLEEHYQRGDGWTETKAAYSQFRAWLADNGYRSRTEATFAEAVRRVFGIRKERARITGEQKVVYRNLQSKVQDDF